MYTSVYVITLQSSSKTRAHNPSTNACSSSSSSNNNHRENNKGNGYITSSRSSINIDNWPDVYEMRLSKESLKMWSSPPYFVRESVSSELTGRCKGLLSARTPAQLSVAYERYKAKAAECMGSGIKSYSGTQIGFEHCPSFISHGSNPPRIKSSTTSPLVYGPDEAFAYVRFRLLPAFAVWHRVLEEVYALASNPKFDPTDMLDFGSGPGSAVLAARNVWEEEVMREYGVMAADFGTFHATCILTPVSGVFVFSGRSNIKKCRAY